MISFMIAFVLSSVTFAQTSTFSQCSEKAAPRTELDGFCPRIEGIHPAGCCPQLFKQPPLQCFYAIYKERGQAYLADSSYTVCENGTNVQKPCCRVQQRACVEQKIQLPFLPRLLHRNESCCFENCPSATYWRTPPAKGNLTPEHEITTAASPVCTGTTLPECSSGTAESCPASSPCPVAPGPDPGGGTPVPGPNPSVPPDPNPGNGGNPGPIVPPVSPGGS